MLEGTLKVVGGLLTLATFIWGIFTWQDGNMRPFLERQMAIYREASEKAAIAVYANVDAENAKKNGSTGANKAAEDAKKATNDFLTVASGPLKTVADGRIVAVASLMRHALGAGPPKACDSERKESIPLILADCMRESIESGWSLSLPVTVKQNFCNEERYKKGLVCVSDEGAAAGLLSDFNQPRLSGRWWRF